MITTFDKLLEHVKIQDVTFEEFCSRLSILDISDKSGTFKVRSNIYDFLGRVAKNLETLDHLV